ncbi:MAG: hypothetical protein R2710_18630 [Acidimicrobiales bacterium]
MDLGIRSEVDSGIVERRAIRLDAGHVTLTAEQGTEEAATAIGVDERSVLGIRDHLGCGGDERFGAVGPALEERVGRDAKADAVDDVGDGGRCAVE